jgi:hypothetical protein
VLRGHSFDRTIELGGFPPPGEVFDQGVITSANIWTDIEGPNLSALGPLVSPLDRKVRLAEDLTNTLCNSRRAAVDYGLREHLPRR